jgi:hypothetical protein
MTGDRIVSRVGRPPRTTAGRRAWRWVDIAARYAINALLVVALLAAVIAGGRMG